MVSHQRGPTYWLRHLTKTENYHWRQQGVEPVMPFPDRPFLDRKIDLEALRQHSLHQFTEQDPPDYLDVIMGFLLTSKVLFILRHVR